MAYKMYSQIYSRNSIILYNYMYNYSCYLRLIIGLYYVYIILRVIDIFIKVARHIINHKCYVLFVFV